MQFVRQPGKKLPVHPQVCNLMGRWIWPAPGGRHFAFPDEGGGIAVHVAKPGLPRLRRIPLPEEARVPTGKANVAFGQRRDGLQAGALHPSGEVVAVATLDSIFLLDARGEVNAHLAFCPSAASIDAGEVEEEEEEGMGEPDALAFSPDGRLLWLSCSHVDESKRVYALDGDSLEVRGHLDAGRFPIPAMATLHPHPTAPEALLEIACGEEGTGVIHLSLDGVLERIEPDHWQQAPLFVAGVVPRGDAYAVVERHKASLRSWDTGEVLRTTRMGELGFGGAVLGPWLLVPEPASAPGRVVFHVLLIESLATAGQVELGSATPAGPFGGGVLVTVSQPEQVAELVALKP
jgi:hypothetical protein